MDGRSYGRIKDWQEQGDIEGNWVNPVCQPSMELKNIASLKITLNALVVQLIQVIYESLKTWQLKQPLHKRSKMEFPNSTLAFLLWRSLNFSCIALLITCSLSVVSRSLFQFLEWWQVVGVRDLCQWEMSPQVDASVFFLSQIGAVSLEMSKFPYPTLKAFQLWFFCECFLPCNQDWM